MTTGQSPEQSRERAADRSARSFQDAAKRIAHDIDEGSYVNLGIGKPTMVSDHIDGRNIHLHSENGVIGYGREASAEEADVDLINAGKTHVVEVPGVAYFGHSDSFAMIRGRHVDFSVLGAFEVSHTGDLANWSTGEPDSMPAVGGAMDLAAGAKSVIVLMSLFDKQGHCKVVPECTLPLTGAACVDRVYTEFCTLELDRSSAAPVIRVLEVFGTTEEALRGHLEHGDTRVEFVR